MYQNDKSDDDFFLVRKDVFPLIKEQKLRKYTKVDKTLAKDVIFEHARDMEKIVC